MKRETAKTAKPLAEKKASLAKMPAKVKAEIKLIDPREEPTANEREIANRLSIKVSELRAQIKAGIDQLDRGEGEEWDIEEIKAKGRALLGSRQTEARD